MVIDAREPKILERPGAQGIEHTLLGRGRLNLAACHLFEQRVKLSGIHRNGSGDRFIDLFSNPTVT